MMWVSALLLVYAFVVGTFGALVLRRAAWATRAPRLAVTAWQILCWSVLLAVGLTGLLMFKPGPHTGTGGLAASFHMLVTGDLARLELARWCTFFVLLSVVVLGRTSLSVTRSVLRSRRERTEHLRQLSFLASHDATRDALLLENPTAIAYCLPGPRPAVVLTTGALAALDGDELKVVLEHERAHLRERHDLILATSRGLERAWRRVPLFRWAYEEQKRLLELAADDAAARHGARRTVASAMVRMAESPIPLPALGAGGADVVARVDRMLAPHRPMGLPAMTAVVATLVLVAALPLLAAAVPLATTAGLQACGLT